jgi:hypothetical protein
VYDGDVSFARAHQLGQLAKARWRMDNPNAPEGATPPPKQLYMYTRTCFRELLVDMHGSEEAARAAVAGKSMLQALAPTADLSWMRGVYPEQEETQARRDVLQWEEEFNDTHGAWSDGLPQDLGAFEAAMDAKATPKEAPPAAERELGQDRQKVQTVNQVQAAPTSER